ncbi:MAG: ATP-binding protein, partial [Planctomycetaceae bacterium]|nr:ATP-binding protein [Planctomycetaceae bacterium]
PENPYSKILSTDEFLSAIYRLCEKCTQSIVPFKNVIKQMSRLLERNKHLGLVKKLKSYSLSEQEELIVLRFCHYLIDLEEDEMEIKNIEKIYDRASDFRSAKLQLKAGTHPLQQKQIIEAVNDNGFADVNRYRLTGTAKESLLFELEETVTKKSKGIIDSNTIVEKQLFYPEKTSREIKELIDTLNEEKFSAVQNRLKEQRFRIGFACLFSGAPGTGKTETAYQIAKKTGRGIMIVDIAETKSMWFGESEKIIKKIFTQYRKAIKYSEKIPILLFNEADAIISKRQGLSEGRNGPGKTENAIQNIILQEIENLNGILIATTNLTQNMDKAFERRFLFKIEFEKPTLETRVSIWQTLIPELSDQDAGILAEKFEFSGGQIENIARRKTVAAVLSGIEPSLEKLLEYCKQELSDNKEIKRIGFKI